MRHFTSLVVVAVGACLMFTDASAKADSFFVDHFNGPTFNPNLIDIDGTYFFSGGKTGTNGPRSYVRTLESNYASIDFQADLIYSIGGSGGGPGVFFGMGRGIKDPSFFNEPDAAIYALDHTNGFPFWPNSNVVVRVNAPGAGGISDKANTPFPDGTAYTRITKIGDSITFQYDHNYNGSTFLPDGSYTASLSAVAPFLSTGPSYLFFGTDLSPSRFDSIQVSGINAAPVPLPAAVWGGVLLMGLVGAKRAVLGRARGDA